jgi:hypothetical protein
MFACFSKKTPQKNIDLKERPFPKILLKINYNDLAFDPNQGGFTLENGYQAHSGQDELELQNQLNVKKERINLFKKKIEELEKKLKFVEKIAKQDQEEYLLYEELYSDSVKKFSHY